MKNASTIIFINLVTSHRACHYVLVDGNSKNCIKKISLYIDSPRSRMACKICNGQTLYLQAPEFPVSRRGVDDTFEIHFNLFLINHTCAATQSERTVLSQPSKSVSIHAGTDAPGSSDDQTLNKSAPLPVTMFCRRATTVTNCV
jgi:hypothetical protein